MGVTPAGDSSVPASAGTVDVTVDGRVVSVPAGTDLLAACDAAGCYVPRLCSYPGLPSLAVAGPEGWECGLCLVRVIGEAKGGEEGRLVLACATAVAPGLRVITCDDRLQAERRTRLARLMHEHPRACLTCPDSDGCQRDGCSYGTPEEARCCDKAGTCELAQVVAFVGGVAALGLTGGPVVPTARASVVEGRIRREPGLCVGCGRCVAVCAIAEGAGRALEMVETVGVAQAGDPEARSRGEGAKMGGLQRADSRLRPTPKGGGTLRAAGCTFCGRCVLVCPTGALTAPGEAGRRWLAGRCERSGLAPLPLPSRARQTVAVARRRLPHAPGVLQLFSADDVLLAILGVADLASGLERALGEPVCCAAQYVVWDEEPLYTLRESELLTRHAQRHGSLPPGNDLGDDLFADDLLGDEGLWDDGESS